MSKLTILALAGVFAFATTAAFAQAPKPDTSGNSSMTNPATPNTGKIDTRGDQKPADPTATGKPAQPGSSAGMKTPGATTGAGNADPETRLDSSSKAKENSNSTK